uniref:Nanos-type domain-containing protein n=1 Tax=Calidris pygmaea TaxID=425635 RepID=A0A8C3PIF6_9CHAR
MEPCPPFQMWRDYLGLAAAVAALARARREEAEGDAAAAAVTPASPSPAQPAAPGPPRKGVCAFCRHNGEAASVWRGHSLRDAGGRVLCPVLRGYVCPQCGATQEGAHTRRFCPLTRRSYASVYSRTPPRTPAPHPACTTSPRRRPGGQGGGASWGSTPKRAKELGVWGFLAPGGDGGHPRHRAWPGGPTRRPLLGTRLN